MKILVTGGAGYIGSVLTPMLLEKGYSVTVLDNLSFQQSSLMTCFQNPHFRFIKGDTHDEVLLRELLKEVDAVIPLAALVGAPICDAHPQLAEMINLRAIQKLLKALSPNQMLLYPCTNSGYGIGQKEKYCDETTPLKPLSLYGHLKVQSEEEILSSGKGLSFRLATVFGLSPRMRLDLLVNDFTVRACRDGSIILFEEHFKRNYIHISDVARTFLFGLKNYQTMRGEAYNVGLSDANLSKWELCQKIKEQVPRLYIHCASVGEDPDKRDYIVSNEKLEGLGWKPLISLDEGIRQIIAAYPMLQARAFQNA